MTAFIVAACAVIRSTTAPAHERVAFAGFVILELVLASSHLAFLAIVILLALVLVARRRVLFQ